MQEEKALNRRRDQLAEARRALPWVPVDKGYRFEGPGGERTLPELCREVPPPHIALQLLQHRSTSRATCIACCSPGGASLDSTSRSSTPICHSATSPNLGEI